MADFRMTTMNSRSHASTAMCSRAMARVVIAFAIGSSSNGQTAPARQPIPFNQNQATPSEGRDAGLSTQDQAEEELRQGTALTSQGSFRDAIPHLLIARKEEVYEYAANFNLALCYVGTSQFKEAIQILNHLRGAGHD